MSDSDVVQTLTPQGIALVLLLQVVHLSVSLRADQMLSGATRIHSELVSHQGASGALSSLEDMLEIAIAGITEEGEQLHTYIVSHVGPFTRPAYLGLSGTAAYRIAAVIKCEQNSSSFDVA